MGNRAALPGRRPRSLRTRRSRRRPPNWPPAPATFSEYRRGRPSARQKKELLQAAKGERSPRSPARARRPPEHRVKEQASLLSPRKRCARRRRPPLRCRAPQPKLLGSGELRSNRRRAERRWAEPQRDPARSGRSPTEAEQLLRSDQEAARRDHRERGAGSRKETQAKTAIEQQIHDEAVALKRIDSESTRTLLAPCASAYSPASIRSSPSRRSTLTWRPSWRPSKRARDTARPERATPWRSADRRTSHIVKASLTSTQSWATGAYFERDHIIDQSFRCSQGNHLCRRFGESSIDLDKLVDAAPDEKASGRLRARRRRTRPLFPARIGHGRLHRGQRCPTISTGLVHRRVTKASGRAQRVHRHPC